MAFENPQVSPREPFWNKLKRWTAAVYGVLSSKKVRAVYRVLSSKMALAIYPFFGIVAGFFINEWWVRPKINIEITSLKHELPEEVKVFLPSHEELKVLGVEIETLLLQKKPEVYRIFKQPYPPRPPGQQLVAPEPFIFPLSLQMLSISELRQLHYLSVLLPPDVFMAEVENHKKFVEHFSLIQEQEKKALDQLIADNPNRPLGFFAQKEDAVKAGAAELERQKRQQAEFDKTAANLHMRPGKLKDAEKKINQLEADLKNKRGIFTVEAIITNSGGRPLSLLPPVTLYYLEEGNTGRAEMVIQPRNEPILILPDESKRITLWSHRIDRQHENDRKRERMRERFGFEEKCQLGFHTSDGGTKKSDPIKFAEK